MASRQWTSTAKLPDCSWLPRLGLRMPAGGVHVKFLGSNGTCVFLCCSSLCTPEACTKFLKKLLADNSNIGHPGVTGQLHWGPLLGWGWMTGKEFHTGWGYCAPAMDTTHEGDWGKIGWDAIKGIKACALSLGAVFTVCPA